MPPPPAIGTGVMPPGGCSVMKGSGVGPIPGGGASIESTGIAGAAMTCGPVGDAGGAAGGFQPKPACAGAGAKQNAAVSSSAGRRMLREAGFFISSAL
jgi:hypothetical protein